MEIFIKYQGRTLLANLAEAHTLALPLVPDQANASCYYAEPPRAEVIRAGSFVGSVQEGGTVNYERLHLTPHGNGTHTECIGHLTATKEALPQCLEEHFLLAQLISVAPKMQGQDRVMRWEDIAQKLLHTPLPALVIRSLPNTEKKQLRDYSGTNPPYLAPECGKKLARRGVRHLLVDLPSVDKEEDGGKLAVHRGFWQYPEQPRYACTITELIFVPDALPDGMYLLNLQVPRLMMDAVPSQPVLFRLKEANT